MGLLKPLVITSFISGCNTNEVRTCNWVIRMLILPTPYFLKMCVTTPVTTMTAKMTAIAMTPFSVYTGNYNDKFRVRYRYLRCRKRNDFY